MVWGPDKSIKAGARQRGPLQGGRVGGFRPREGGPKSGPVPGVTFFNCSKKTPVGPRFKRPADLRANKKNYFCKTPFFGAILKKKKACG